MLAPKSHSLYHIYSSFLNFYLLYCFHKWKCRHVTVFVKQHISPLLEERDFLFQVVPLPKGKPVKFLCGHSKDILKFLRWQVPLERDVQWSTFVPNRTVQQGQIMSKNKVYLQSCPVYTRWEFVSASVGHNEHLIWVNLPNEHIVSNKHTINELWPRASSHLCHIQQYVQELWWIRNTLD